LTGSKRRCTEAISPSSARTAFHLIEIIEKDRTTTRTQKDLRRALGLDPEMKLCRKIANNEKHFELDPKRYPNPEVKGSVVAEGYGAGRYGRGGYGVGGQSVTLQYDTRQGRARFCPFDLQEVRAIFP